MMNRFMLTRKKGQRAKGKGQRKEYAFRSPFACLSLAFRLCPLPLALCPFLLPTVAVSQTSDSLQVVVNSNQDGPVLPDGVMTLREAIEIVNGTLPLEKLSAAQKAQVSVVNQQQTNGRSRISFNLPPNQTTIRLNSELPPLASPGLVVDGTTQPGYYASRSATAEITIPIPVVAIAPAPDHEILRGLTVVADGVTIRGLSLYSFTARPQGATLPTPPADIFIAHRLPPPDTSQQQPPKSNFPFHIRDIPPKDVTIEDNWLGLTPDEKMPQTTSAFGVSVFNSLGTTIRRNRIYNHDGSGIITSVRAENLKVLENIIVGNGIAGMPDAVRLEGIIDRTEISANLICGNDGAGVYLFKPEGQAQIQNNQIIFNGRRLRRAAVYLMGSGHRVTGNQIRYQTGPGVVVTAYPKSDRNLIQGNSFSGLEGLSIDLNTLNPNIEQSVDVIDYEVGDGPNPQRNSPNRRKDTANSAINAPQFVSPEFFTLNGKVTVFGTADPGSQVEVYRVNPEPQTPNSEPNYGPLSESLGTATADSSGRFGLSLGLQPGDRLSAIATLPQYGTSEPAFNASVRAVDGTSPPESPPTPVVPRCTTPPPPPTPPIPPVTPPSPLPIRIRVPRNIHFALDKDIISPDSAAVLDRIAAVLQQYPFILVEIQGYTDPRASNAYNLNLGSRRSLSARNYLLKRGIAPERMTIRSFGKTKLRTPGNGRVDYARDRRVEFILKDARGLDIINEEQDNDLQLEPARGTR